MLSNILPTNLDKAGEADSSIDLWMAAKVDEEERYRQGYGVPASSQLLAPSGTPWNHHAFAAEAKQERIYRRLDSSCSIDMMN